MIDTDLQNENVRIVRTALDNAMKGRLDLVAPFFAADCQCHVAEGLPYGGVYHGWQGYLQLLDEVRKFWSDVRQDSIQSIPAGNKVILHFGLDGHIAKNGEHVQMPILAIWELKDGKISKILPFYFDTKRIADLAAKSSS